MTKIYRKILDEVGDQISSTVYSVIRSIDRNLDRIESLDAIVAQMKAADAADIFRLVSSLPASGDAETYYVMLNTTTNKYEEYRWNGSSYDKIGLIGDLVYPTLATAPVATAVDKSGAGYSSANPSTSSWHEYDSVSGDYTLSEDTSTTTTSYTAVDSTAAGYSEKNPSTEDVSVS